MTIRVRRTTARFRWQRRYEVEKSGNVMVLRRGRALRCLERIAGMGDAWAFINAADEAYESGHTGWAVEYERH